MDIITKNNNIRLIFQIPFVVFYKRMFLTVTIFYVLLFWSITSLDTISKRTKIDAKNLMSEINSFQHSWSKLTEDKKCNNLRFFSQSCIHC